MSFYTNVQQVGNNILIRGYDNNGLPFKREVKYKPYVFVPTQVISEYKTIKGKNVSKIEFDSIRDAKNFIYENKETNSDIYGLTSWIYPFINDRYQGKIEFDKNKIKVVTIDIECEVTQGFPDIDKAENEITAITIGFKGFKIALGCGDYTPTAKHIKYYKFTNEHAMLLGFLEMWKNIMPDVVTGWNIEFFDLPYLINRICRILDEEDAKKMSPWHIIETNDVTIRNKKHNVKYPLGIAVLDYYQLYQKFNEKKKESYKLEFIAEDEELKVKKLNFKEKYKTLEEMRLKDFQMYMEYNIQDVEVVEQLDAKKGFLNLAYTIAYWAKINFEDVFGSVKPWDVIIHNYLIEKKIVVSPYKEPFLRELIGAHVKEPVPGLYKWCVSLDLDSLYPHLMMMYNISPDTYAGKLQQNISIDNILDGGLDSIRDILLKNNVTIAANLTLYTKDKQGFMSVLMHQMYDLRKKIKEEMLEHKAKKDDNLKYLIDSLHNMQWALKILLNSCYGAMANQYFRWYDINQAEAITSSGQLAIRWIEKDLNQYINKIFKTTEEDYVIAIDTDAVYLKMEKFADQFGLTDPVEITKKIDTVCKKLLQPFINKSFDRLAEYVNAYEQSMRMKRESIADKGIWLGKKHYILNCYDIEGVQYNDPEIKTVGIETQKSSTPKICRVALKNAIKIIMKKDEIAVQQFVKEFNAEFMKKTFDEISFPRGVNGMRKYASASQIWDKGCPIHTKAALIYNHLIKSNGLDKKYQYIAEGDKIKFAYMKSSNPYNIPVFAILDEVPVELDIIKWVDYDMQFQKTFLEPLNNIMKVLNWSPEKQNTLESFFE